MADSSISDANSYATLVEEQKKQSTSTADVQDFTSGKYDLETDYAYRSAAAGGFLTQMQTFLTGLDRFSRNVLPTNCEHSGLTFITRPKLNFTSSSLRQDSKLLPLDSINPTDFTFMIRALLDTKFSKEPKNRAMESPWINIKNPFNVPLCNSLVSISGFPDPVLQTLTTEGGYFSEDQTFVIGSDRENRTYDLSLTFKDIHYGPVLAIMEFWHQYMANVADGTVVAYKEDIDAQRLNYTVSIYRFMLDPTRKYVTRYAKATGCFPKSPPLGAVFNVNEGELTASAIKKFTIPFVANKIEYNKVEILTDFRTLVRRYCSDIESLSIVPPEPIHNFTGIPWIATTKNGIELQFRASETEIKNNIFTV